jgi:DNA-binding transcriptional ArsR family regulator
MQAGIGTSTLRIIADLASIDCAMAWFDAPETEFLCEPSAHEIVSLLVMTALSVDRVSLSAPLHDATRDNESTRIERLSEEVRRLAATIEQLTAGVSGGNALADARTAYAAMRHLPVPAHQDLHGRPRDGRAASAANRNGPPTPGEIRALLRARRMRDQFLPGDLFADPAWDMILDLLAARLAGQRVSVSSLCIAASVPPTTALRWIRQLTERGILSRIDDPEDGRRVFIDLTEDATHAVVAWAQAVRRNGGLFSGAGAT